MRPAAANRPAPAGLTVFWDIAEQSLDEAGFLWGLRDTALLSPDRTPFEVETASLMCECRPFQISQILVNLVNNAHDAVAGQSGSWIKIQIRPSGEYAEIRVSDSGWARKPNPKSRITNPDRVERQYL